MSVIIACLNVADTLGAQLEALAAQDFDESWEVLIADNGCTDGTVALAEGFRPRLDIRIVDARAKRGKPFALNTAVRRARGDLLVFCDADDEVAPGWLSAIAHALKTHAFVASRMEIDRLNPEWLVEGLGRHPQTTGLQEYPSYLPHAGGSTLAVRRSVHEAVGGFDEEMMRLQDTDYCWRIQMLGVPLHFVPEAVISVRYRNSYRSLFRQAYGCGEYNARISKKYRAKGLPRTSLRRGIMSLCYLPRHFAAIRNRPGYVNFVWQFGYRMGRLGGSLRHRVFAL